MKTRRKASWKSYRSLFYKHSVFFLPQRTPSGFTKDTKRRVDSSRLVFPLIWLYAYQMSRKMQSTLRFVSFVKPLCVRCGKKIIVLVVQRSSSVYFFPVVLASKIIARSLFLAKTRQGFPPICSGSIRRVWPLMRSAPRGDTDICPLAPIDSTFP